MLLWLFNVCENYYGEWGRNTDRIFEFFHSVICHRLCHPRYCSGKRIVNFFFGMKGLPPIFFREAGNKQ